MALNTYDALLTYLPMPKSKIDKVREERIRNESIVDCYNESERFSGWYCHLEEKLKFPFGALCVATSPASPLKRGEQVEVIADWHYWCSRGYRF